MGNRREAVLDLCRHLVKIPSLSGQERQIIGFLRDYYANHGFTSLFVDEYGSLTVSSQGNREGPVLLFDGHVDTVPAPDPDAWDYPPFDAVIDKGRLYGRGSSDMKGAVAAMAVAATEFLRQSGGEFKGQLILAAVVQEEVFEGVAARSISERYRPDLVVIGEATSLNLAIGQRGRAEIKLEAFGTPAHSANPEKGENAVYLMADLIRALSDLGPPTHPVLGSGILELTDIKSSPYPGASVVPSYCSATYDRRLLPGESRKSVLEPVRSVLENLAMQGEKVPAQVSFARGQETCYTGKIMEAERFFPGWLFDEDEWFVKQAMKGLRNSGLTTQLSHYSFCTNGSHYAGEKGIPTLGFGPSRESLAHTQNEYIELDQLARAVDGYLAIMKAFLR